MEEAFYIDSNVFIYAALNRGETGMKARSLLQKIKTSGLNFSTSALTFDEVFWKVFRERSREDALNATKTLLLVSEIRFIPVDLQVLFLTQSLLQKYRLDPRDAIHLACARSKNIKNIISDDKDFDKIEGIKRIGI